MLGIPTVPFKTSSDAALDLTLVHSIIVDSAYATARDPDGLTTIPPTLWEFAETFRDDLAGIGIKTTVTTGLKATNGAIFCTLDPDKSAFIDAAGRPTSEGYRLSVGSSGITISGASPLGVWWATRTVLQQAVLNDKKIAQGAGIDAPGWGERGMMVSTFDTLRFRSVENSDRCSWMWHAITTRQTFSSRCARTCPSGSKMSFTSI